MKDIFEPIHSFHFLKNGDARAQADQFCVLLAEFFGVPQFEVQNMFYAEFTYFNHGVAKHLSDIESAHAIGKAIRHIRDHAIMNHHWNLKSLKEMSENMEKLRYSIFYFSYLSTLYAQTHKDSV